MLSILLSSCQVSREEGNIQRDLAKLFEATQQAERLGIVATPLPDQDPIYVARIWLRAIYGGDGFTLAEYTCEEMYDQVSTDGFTLGVAQGILNALQGGVLGTELDDLSMNWDDSQVVFEVISLGEFAEIRTSGISVWIIGGSFDRSEVDGWMKLVYEDQKWKVCSSYIDADIR